MFYYHTLKELEDLVNENKLEVWQVIEQSDMEENGRTKEQSYEKMLNMYLAMKEADKNYNGNLKTASKRAGGDGEKIHRYNVANKNICGKFIGNVMEKAIKMGESNACMRRIVAAPTAGACGVLPAVLISYQEEYNLSETISKSYHLYPVDENGNKVDNVTLSQDTIDATINVNEG